MKTILAAFILLVLTAPLFAQNGSGTGSYGTIGPGGGSGGTFNTNNPTFTGTTTVSNLTASGTLYISTVVATNISGNATNLTGASRNLGVINYMSTTYNGNSGYDWTTATSAYVGQLGISAYDSRLAAPEFWYSWTNGYGTNVWGAPWTIPAMQNLGNPNWQDIQQNPYEPLQFWLGMGPQQASQEATWSSGTNNIGNYIQPDFIFRNANPWQGCCSLDMRAASTNSTMGYLLGNDKDGWPIYISPFGFQIMEIGQQYVAGEANQAPSHCLLSSDSRFDTYFSLNGLRTGDTQYGQIAALVLDTSTFSTQTNTIAEQNAHPLFRVPLQVTNCWMVRNPKWKDSLLIDTIKGTGTGTNGYWTLGGTNGANISGLLVTNGNTYVSSVSAGGISNLYVLQAGGAQYPYISGIYGWSVAGNGSFLMSSWYGQGSSYYISNFLNAIWGFYSQSGTLLYTNPTGFTGTWYNGVTASGPNPVPTIVNAGYYPNFTINQQGYGIVGGIYVSNGDIYCRNLFSAAAPYQGTIGGQIAGNGSLVTSLNAGLISAGTIGNSYLPSAISIAGAFAANSATITNSLTNLSTTIPIATFGGVNSVGIIKAPNAVTVGASPFTFINPDPQAIECYISGTNATVAKNGVTIFPATSGATNEYVYFVLQPTNALTLTYAGITPYLKTNAW